VGKDPSDIPIPPTPTTPPDAPQHEPDRQLLAQVYDQLRAVARARLARESPGHSLQATELVHEAYLKLQHHPSILKADRGRFFGAAAEAMRRILIDHARTKGRVKRGGNRKRSVSDVAELAAESDPDQILALDEAICRLEQTEPQAAQVVKLRFFAGLSVAETAEVTGLSERTVKREWQFARAWMYRALGDADAPDDGQPDQNADPATGDRSQ
jgi:RNA polymerase sigma factor (TIGR02999 family)